jgi:hypothetical protein
MLSGHSRLYVPDETGFLPFLRVPVEALLTRDQVSYVLRRIGRLNRFWKGMVVDIDAFFDELPEPRLHHVLDALYRVRVSQHGAVRWGDKTPLYVRYIPFLNRVFPNAQFIHVIRDGRDATVSALKKWGNRMHIDPYYLLTNWVRNVSAGQDGECLVGTDRYLEIRYESLVSDPELTLKSICAFLSEQLEPAMLDQRPLASLIGGGIDDHVEPQYAVTSTHVGRWEREMSTFEKKLADHLAGPTLTSLGYPLADLGSYTYGERTRNTCLAGKFFLSDGCRRALYDLGLLTLNRNRRA